MKRIALVLAAVLGVSAFAATSASAWFQLTGMSLTGSAPSGTPSGVSSAANGVRIFQGVQGYRITLCAVAGQTLSGAGSVQLYWYDLGTADNAGPVAWSRNPSIDETVSVTATSCAGAACRCQTFPDRRVSAGTSGYFMPVLSGVTTSSGLGAVYVELFGNLP